MVSHVFLPQDPAQPGGAEHSHNSSSHWLALLLHPVHHSQYCLTPDIRGLSSTDSENLPHCLTSKVSLSISRPCLTIHGVPSASLSHITLAKKRPHLRQEVEVHGGPGLSERTEEMPDTYEGFAKILTEGMNEASRFFLQCSPAWVTNWEERGQEAPSTVDSCHQVSSPGWQGSPLLSQLAEGWLPVL